MNRVNRKPSIWLLTIFVIVLVGLACNAGGAGSPAPATRDTSEGSTGGATGGNPSPATLPPVEDPTAHCPAASADSQSFISKENGYCFLVPASMKAGGPDYQYPNDVTTYEYPPRDPNAMEFVNASISVSINAPAEGLDSVSYANRWINSSYGMAAGGVPPGDEIKVAETTIGGVPAALVTNIPGMVRQQMAFVVAGGYRYTITLVPQPGENNELDSQVNVAWDTVTKSIVFFPPSVPHTVVTPDIKCAKAGASTFLHIDYVGGVCALIPTGFELGTVQNTFETGPSLGDFAGGSIRASINISFAGPAGGKTVMELYQPFDVNAVPDSAQETTINGYPAVVSLYNGPVKARQAVILANDRSYTLNNQPYNDPVMTGGSTDVENVWQTVTSSIAFFTPFR